MPKSRKRNKRHDGRVRAQRFFNGTIVWTWEGLRDVEGNQIPPQAVTKTCRGYEYLEPAVINAVMRHANKWVVCVRAICMAETGDPWIDTRYVEWHGKLADVGEKYLDWRSDIRATRKIAHIWDMGWMAQTFTGSYPADDPHWVDEWSKKHLGTVNEYRKLVWEKTNKEIEDEA